MIFSSLFYMTISCQKTYLSSHLIHLNMGVDYLHHMSGNSVVISELPGRTEVSLADSYSFRSCLTLVDYGKTDRQWQKPYSN